MRGEPGVITIEQLTRARDAAWACWDNATKFYVSIDPLIVMAAHSDLDTYTERLLVDFDRLDQVVEQWYETSSAVIDAIEQAADTNRRDLVHIFGLSRPTAHQVAYELAANLADLRTDEFGILMEEGKRRRWLACLHLELREQFQQRHAPKRTSAEHANECLVLFQRIRQEYEWAKAQHATNPSGQLDPEGRPPTQGVGKSLDPRQEVTAEPKRRGRGRPPEYDSKDDLKKLEALEDAQKSDPSGHALKKLLRKWGKDDKYPDQLKSRIRQRNLRAQKKKKKKRPQSPGTSSTN